MTAPEPRAHRLPPQIDTSKPSLARVYDALLGGKDNFDVDRALLAQMVELTPEMPAVARANRRWLIRAVRWLARDAGIDQFLDVGSGLPTAENTHEVAQSVNPEAVVVYADNDPAVIAHGRVLLEDNEHTYFIPGDLTKPEEILSDPVVTSHLDLDRPIALLQCLTVHHIPDLADAQRVMAGYVDRMASGSYVGMTHAERPEPGSEGYEELWQAYEKFREASAGFTLRTRDEIASLFPGMEFVEPGLVVADDWWPEGPRVGELSPMARLMTAGLARKP